MVNLFYQFLPLQIELDLLRTLPNNKHYDGPHADGIAKLRRILLAYSVHNPEVEYCQVNIRYTLFIVLGWCDRWFNGPKLYILWISLSVFSINNTCNIHVLQKRSYKNFDMSRKLSSSRWHVTFWLIFNAWTFNKYWLKTCYLL